MKQLASGCILSITFALCSFARGQAPSGSTLRQQPASLPAHGYLSDDPSPESADREALQRNYIFNNWHGLRTRLAARGVVPTILLITDPFGNLRGGQRTGATDYNLAGIDVRLDTVRLFGWRGGQFNLGAAVNFGTSLSRQYVGNSSPIQLADVAGAQPRLTYLSYTQTLFSGRVSLRAGRVSLNSVFGEEFAGSEYTKAMASVAFDLVPQGIFLNAKGAAGYPKTTWGMRVRVSPTSRAYIQVAAYNADTEQLKGSHHGLDLSLRGPVLVMAEAGTTRPGDAEPSLQKQHVKFGMFYNGGSYVTVDHGALRPATGLVGLYALADRKLLGFKTEDANPRAAAEVSRWGDAERERHLGAFTSVVIVPQKRSDQVPYFFNAGLVAYGPTAHRPRDTSAVGFAYSSNSRGPAALPDTTAPNVPPNEMTFEANYGFAAKPGLSIQPDLQYSISPRGSAEISPGFAKSRVPNAFILGLHIVCNF